MAERNRAKEVAHQAASALLNIDRGFHCDCISKGVEVPGLRKDAEGYYTVSYHMAGMDSGWVTQSRLRKKYPNLDTKVVNVVDMPCDWNVEVRVRLKKETDHEQA